MGNHDFLERVFALAGGGMVRTIDDLRGALLAEGYTQKELWQLGGPVLSRQLRARIEAAAGRPGGPSGHGTIGGE